MKRPNPVKEVLESAKKQQLHRQDLQDMLAAKRHSTARARLPMQAELAVVEEKTEIEPRILDKLSAEQLSALDQAVDELNQAYVHGNVATARNMGRIILERFFGGDVARFDGERQENWTYRALAERDDLRPSFTSLWYAVKVHEHFVAIAQQVADALTLAHHRQLAHVTDEGMRQELAEQAVAGGWTSERLAAEIRARRPAPKDGAKTRGRRPVPEVVKRLSHVCKTLREQLEDSTIPAIAAQSLTDEQRADAIADAKRLAEMAAQVLAQLGG